MSKTSVAGASDVRVRKICRPRKCLFREVVFSFLFMGEGGGGGAPRNTPAPLGPWHYIGGMISVLSCLPLYLSLLYS